MANVLRVYLLVAAPMLCILHALWSESTVLLVEQFTPAIGIMGDMMHLAGAAALYFSLILILCPRDKTVYQRRRPVQVFIRSVLWSICL